MADPGHRHPVHTAPASSGTPDAGGGPAAGTSLPDGINVVYVCSHGRSGSTLLGAVLGMMDGHCFAGEVRDVWTDGLDENLDCGCGEKFRNCPFWTKVFERAFGGFDSTAAKAAKELFARYRRLPDTLHFFKMVFTLKSDAAYMKPYTDALYKLYRAIHEVSGCTVIVDTSKTLRYGIMLAHVPGVQIRIINLIRDVRAIVYSRSRPALDRHGNPKGRPGDGRRRYRIVRVVGKWVARNYLCMRAIRYYGGFRLLHEDFVADQTLALTRVGGAAQCARVLALLKAGDQGAIVQHQVAGNWLRGLKISLNEAWREKLSRPVRALVTALAWPWLKSYNSSTCKKT